MESNLSNLGTIAGSVGLTTGAVASYDKPGSSFIAVSGQVAIMTLLPVYLLKDTYTEFQVGVANGVLMAGVCYGWHGFSIDTCVKYGILVGALTFGAVTLFGGLSNNTTVEERR